MTQVGLHRRVLGGLVVIASLAALPQEAAACTCFFPSNVPTSDEIKRDIVKEMKESRAVFAGEVIALDTFAVRMRVERVWKGSLGEFVEFSTGAQRTAEGTVVIYGCDYSFEPGKRYLVFARGASNREMKAAQCGFTGLREPARDTERYLDEIAPIRRRRV